MPHTDWPDTVDNMALGPNHPANRAPEQPGLLRSTMGGPANIPVANPNQPRLFYFDFPGDANTSAYRIRLSLPASLVDFDAISSAKRRAIHDHLKNNGTVGNEFLQQWDNETCSLYWDRQMNACKDKIPASMLNQVHKLLCRSHPSIRDPWTGHTIYINEWNKKLRALPKWMSDEKTPLLPTWRDTLRSKDAKKDQVVPCPSREILLALRVIMGRGQPDDPKGHMASKWEELKACKLEFQISQEEVVQPDPYWAGFEEELAMDPRQEHLYAKVMAAALAAAPAAFAAPAVPVPAAHGEVGLENIDPVLEEFAKLDAHIEILEGLLRDNGIKVPPRPVLCTQPQGGSA